MARARNIKPGFFRNEDLVELPFQTRLLFIGLWTMADREGRLENRPKKIKLEIFPADDVDISLEITRLSEAGLVKVYEADGVKCIEVVNFKKHQNPHHREAESELPEPPKGDEKGPQPPENKEASESLGQAPDKPESSRADSGFLIPDSGYLNPEKQQGSASSDASPAESETPSGVRDFPTKDGKAFAVPEQFVQELKSTYPRIDVEYQLQKARLWLIANPGRQKTSRGMTRFLNNWMGNQKPTAEIHPIQSRHNGFDERDYSEGLIEGVPDGVANF